MTSRRRSWFWIGIVAGVIGALIGFNVSRNAAGAGYRLFPLYAAGAAFLCAAGFWWLLLSRDAIYTVRRGAIAGALAGLFAHYLCWYFLILAQDLCYQFWGGCTSSLGEPPVDPIDGLWAAGAFTLFSLLLYGWLTVPLGALVGGLAGSWFRSRFPDERPAQASNTTVHTTKDDDPHQKKAG